MSDNNNPSLEQFLLEAAKCQHPSQLIALFNSYSGEAGVTVYELFTASFHAGLSRGDVV